MRQTQPPAAQRWPNEPLPGVMPEADDWLDAVLRADAAQRPHVADDGFSARLMRRLPARRRAPGPWFLPAMTAVGTGLTVFCTPALDFLVGGMEQLLDFQHFSPAHLAVLVPLAVFYATSFVAVREA